MGYLPLWGQIGPTGVNAACGLEPAFPTCTGLALITTDGFKNTPLKGMSF